MRPQDQSITPKIGGERIPRIGLGTFTSDRGTPAEVATTVKAAIDIGYRLFDCASVYGNEPEIGEVFEQAFLDKKVKREELFIMSKLWNDMHGKGDVLLSCAQTLKDLRLTYLDAYFVHWPFPNYHAPGCDGDARNADSVPFSVERFMNTWKQMERLYDMGLTRHLGMSNMTIKKLESVLPLCRIKPTLIEMELHPAFQQPELFEYCVKHNIQPVAFSPLGSPQRPERDKTVDDVSAIDLPSVVQAAKSHGIHPAAVCLKWAVQRGQVPIPFTTNLKYLKENYDCVQTDPLSEEEMKAIAADDANCRLIKGQVFLWEGAKGWEELWDE